MAGLTTPEYQTRAAALMRDLERLLTAPLWRLGDVVTQKPKEAEVEGVYLLSLPSAPETMLYAGRTKTKTVLGRLADHRSVNTGSDLRGMLTRWRDHPQMPDE